METYCVGESLKIQTGYPFDHAERFKDANTPDLCNILPSCFRPSYGPCKLTIRPFESATF